MSTKTTFKRIALVTVAALGLGVMSVAPSNAAPQADTLTLAATTATATVGVAARVNVTVAFSQETSSDTMTLTLGYVSAPAGFGTGEVMFTNPATAVTTDLPAGVTTDTNTASARVAKISAPSTAYVNKTLAVTLTPTKVGVYVIRVTPADGAATPAAISSVAQTITFTVSAKTVKSSSVFMGTGGSGGSDTATADATISVVSTASATHRARIDVASIYGITANDTVTAADAPAVVVTTDKGLVSKTNDFTAGAKSVTTAAATDGDPSYWVFSNGDVGKATITITVGTAAAVTKTVTFKGPATALVATASGSANKTWTGIGAGKNTTHYITAKDSEGTSVDRPTGTLTVTSSDTSVATASFTTANETVTVVGVKAGTTTITVSDPATTGKATAATYVVTVKANKPTTAPTITFDKTAYGVGEVITMTVNADMADSATAQIFTGALVNSASVTVVPGTTALSTDGVYAIVGGKAEYKFYAPAVSGTFTVTGTGGSDIDLTTLLTAPKVSTTVDITNPGVDAATVAAEAAEAAAQDATDAALDATTAAEAAGALAQEAVDLVTELSAEVTKLIAGVRAALTYLTKLVMKLAAK